MRKLLAGKSKKGVDKTPFVWYNKEKTKGNKTMTNTYFDTINWTYLETCAEAGITVECYISEDRNLMKQVWNDGYVEIFEIVA